MSISSDTDYQDNSIPTLSDELDQLRHFTLDILRKMRSLDDKLALLYNDVYELELHHQEQKKINSSFALFILLLIFFVTCIIFTLMINTLVK